MHPLQRRLLIVSSYILGDEGRHWREHNKKTFNFVEVIYRIGQVKGIPQEILRMRYDI